MMNRKEYVIARAIKNGKWLHIHYQQDEGPTTFWAAIKDIDPEKRLLIGDLFNSGYIDNHSGGYLSNTTFYFDKIISAELLEETTYQVPISLLERIENEPDRFQWLDFYLVDENVLHYYLECYEEDVNVFEQRFELISGVDDQTIKRQGWLKLDSNQFRHVLRIIENNIEEMSKMFYKKVKLAMNDLGIANQGKLFPIAYYPVMLDIEQRALKIANQPRFNTKIKHFPLQDYIDEDLETFFLNFSVNREYYIDMIVANLHPGERIDERPYIFEFESNWKANLVLTYQAITQMKKENRLTRPLKAFFGDSDRINRRRREYTLLLYDEKVNLPQLRVISNAIHQDVTYVQGPPGTGKTTTIFNTLLTAFHNGFTVLVTSHNNEAVDGIYEKFKTLHYQDEPIPFPVLRLGNKEYVKKTLKCLLSWYRRYKDFPMTESELKQKLESLKMAINREIGPVKEAIEQYDVREELKEKVAALETMLNKLQEEGVEAFSVMRLQIDYENYINELQRLNQINEQAIIAQLQVPREQLLEYLYYASLEAIFKFIHEDDLIRIVTADTDLNERVLLFQRYLSNHLPQLLKIFPLIITTNISAQRLGEPKPYFDLLIMDEAGQCNVALALIPLVRAERALFVGDPNQLQPVIPLPEEKNNLLKQQYHIPFYYDYKHNSILSTLLQVDQLSLYILLDEHYRCAPEIINFSNQKYYAGQLKIKTRPQKDSLQFIHVNAIPGDKRNTSLSEVEAILHEVRAHPNQSIGIITPFRNQADLITHTLEEQGLLTPNIKVGTIHSFQGNERDRIIISLAVTEETYPGAYHWIKNNRELLNVATTRAKQALTVIGDRHKLSQFAQSETNDLLELISYIESYGRSKVGERTDFYFTSRVLKAKQYNTQAEDEFFETITHFLTTVPNLKVREKQKMTDVLAIDPHDPFFLFANQAHFDFVLYNHLDEPLLAIEVMGLDHYTEPVVNERDEKKRVLCKRHQLVLFEVKNDYVRRYKFIRDMIIQILRS